MWANAQRDGHPDEYRRRPLFNAAKFGCDPLLEYLRPLRLGEEKEKKDIKKKPQDENIMVCPIP